MTPKAKRKAGRPTGTWRRMVEEDGVVIGKSWMELRHGPRQSSVETFQWHSMPPQGGDGDIASLCVQVSHAFTAFRFIKRGVIIHTLTYI